LTRATPRLESVRALTSSAGAETVLGWAAVAENPSEHPLGRAIAAAATDQGVSIGAVSAFYAEPGRGVRATADGRQIAVSRPDSLDDVDPLQTAGARAVVEEIEALGHTAMVVIADGIPVGVLAVIDQVRPDAAAAVSRLEELTGAPAVLLTGDNHRATEAVADSVGIVAMRAQLLPHEKVETARELESGGRKVAVVGDGVNDAPALAAAHLGVAMGRRGSDLTLEAADVVMVRDELIGLPAALRLSRHARRVVKTNLGVRRGRDSRVGRSGLDRPPTTSAGSRGSRGFHRRGRSQRAATAPRRALAALTLHCSGVAAMVTVCGSRRRCRRRRACGGPVRSGGPRRAGRAGGGSSARRRSSA
jgi:cation-transporting P-type ATPase J